MGLLWGISGKGDGDFAKLNSCFPPSWQTQDPAKEAPAADEPKSSWTIMLDVIGTLVDFVCKFKEDIKKLIKEKDKKFARKYQYRMLVQAKMSKMARYRRTKAFWDDLKALAASTLKTVKSWAAATWKAVTAFGSSFVAHVLTMYNTVKQKIKAILNSDFIQTLLKMGTCMEGIKDMVKAIKDVVKGAIDKAKTLSLIISTSNIPLLIKLFIDLMCNFTKFREAFNYLADGIAQSEVNKKYALFGRFFGRLASALTTKRHRHYRLN